MYGIRIVMSTLLALAVVTVGSTTTAQAAEIDANLRADIERVAQQRIFFGHQSVGVNLLDGIQQLSKMAGVSIRVVEVKSANEVAPAMIGHSFVAENGDPLRKLKSFEQAMEQQPTGLDIALVKFCYVDITANTDVKALFADYRATIEGLKAKNPGTTFVHITAPITTMQRGFKATLKKLIGRAPYGAIENIRREEYNELLRQTYRGREPLFDLARVESTTPDGTVVTGEWKGIVAPAMVTAYTDDGGHLNATGRLRAARELVSTLASIPSRPSVGGLTH
jgi:hypothetical protein